MGAYITLGIKKMEIDLEKNYNYTNHSRLFQEKDFDKDIPYYYVDNDDNEIIEYKKGARKHLREIKEELDIDIEVKSYLSERIFNYPEKVINLIALECKKIN